MTGRREKGWDDGSHGHDDGGNVNERQGIRSHGSRIRGEGRMKEIRHTLIV